MLSVGSEKVVTIASGQRYSPAVAVDGDFMALGFFGAMTSGTLAIEVSRDGTNFVPLFMGDSAAPEKWMLPSFVGAACIQFVPIAGAAFVRIDSGVNQAADREVHVRFVSS